MFGKNANTTRGTTETLDTRARGGVAFGPILTGVVVAFGAMFLLSAVIGGILTALGVSDPNVTRGEAVDAGLGAGIGFVVAQFLSYLWGGYTAGRMARGSGLANGLLVPLTAIIVAVAVGAVATGLGASANLNLPFTTNQLPLENDNLVNWGIGIGIAALVGMFLGGALGGGMGARWHTKLERNVADEHTETRHEVDLRDRETPVAHHAATETPDHTTTAQDAEHTSTSRR